MLERFIDIFPSDLFVLILGVISLSLISIKTVQAQEKPQVQDCTIWQTIIRQNKAYKTITVKVFSKTQNGRKRFATIRYIADYVIHEFNFDSVEILLFAPGTKPLRKHLNSGNAVAHVLFRPEPKLFTGPKEQWVGGYSSEKTPVKMTKDDLRFSLNPLFDYKPLDEWSVRNFSYSPGACEMDRKYFRWNYDHTILK